MTLIGECVKKRCILKYGLTDSVFCCLEEVASIACRLLAALDEDTNLEVIVSSCSLRNDKAPELLSRMGREKEE